MKQMMTNSLIPGMVVAEDILDQQQNILIPAGVILTDSIISRLSSYAIFSISVSDQISDFYKECTNFVNRKEAPADCLSDFQLDYEKLVSHLRDTILSAIRTQLPINEKDLVNEAISLLNNEKYKHTNLFELLLYTDYQSDSIYSHSVNVALIAYIFSGWLSYSESDKRLALTCGLFHDIGKVMISPHILLKIDPLSQSEFDLIKTHTSEGYHILNLLKANIHVKAAALSHHEKCDGSGYPYRLSKEEIDPFARLICIADIYEAMTSSRTYRKAFCPFKVIQHFEEEGLKKYDTDMLLTFLQNTANSFLHHKVSLGNGMEGTVFFINKEHTSHPVVQLNDVFLDLSQNENIFIETIF